MPVLLANALLTTARASYNATTGITAAETPYLTTGVLAHIEEDKTAEFLAPQVGGSVETLYVAYVASGTDIATGDTVSSITLLDGVTPWPADWSASAGDVWRVVAHRELPGMLLQQRYLRIARARGSGAAH